MKIAECPPSDINACYIEGGIGSELQEGNAAEGNVMNMQSGRQAQEPLQSARQPLHSDTESSIDASSAAMPARHRRGREATPHTCHVRAIHEMLNAEMTPLPFALSLRHSFAFLQVRIQLRAR